MDKLKQFLRDNFTELLKPIIVLLCICIIIPLALSATNLITKDRISSLEQKMQTEQMQKLFPKAQFEALKDKAGEYYSAEQNGELLGYVFSEKSRGYGGDVAVMVAINTDGSIKAVSVLDVSGETPGLGQNVAKPKFYEQFEGLSGKTEVKKIGADRKKGEITPVSGATISSKAVKNAVNKALERFELINTKTAEGEGNTDEK